MELHDHSRPDSETNAMIGYTRERFPLPLFCPVSRKRSLVIHFTLANVSEHECILCHQALIFISNPADRAHWYLKEYADHKNRFPPLTENRTVWLSCLTPRLPYSLFRFSTLPHKLFSANLKDSHSPKAHYSTCAHNRPDTPGPPAILFIPRFLPCFRNGSQL